MNFCKKRDYTSYEKADISSLGFKAGVFNTWSPLARHVSVLFYKDFEAVKNSHIYAEFPLGKNPDGVWTFDCNTDSGAGESLKSCLYYKYRFTFEDEGSEESFEVCDIWAKCASPDSFASELYDISCDNKPYVNPFKKGFSDAVIFELHVRDWSRSLVTDSTGKFLDIKNNQKLIAHLKELGVTHVQILPSFEYANSVNDKNYNWGYDPFNFNVPSGRYVSEGFTDGRMAADEMRQMIDAFHENDIAVNMDVVYNHTYGTGVNSIYDMTAPGYFYRLKENKDGSLEYYNGSGCGNELASNHKIVRAFIIDSLKHWMKDYHINGFRFDLMGVFETSTMNEIYKELKKLDPHVLVYGEPWCGGECGVKNGCAKPVIDECDGVACFNDDFRDAIKGAEFAGFKLGEVQGVFNDKAICTGLTGSLIKNGGFTENPCRTINYVECHDNFTLFDKLAISYLKRTEFKGDLYKEIGRDGLELVKKQDKLCAAYVILAQGIPFINGGQEFMRTKMGDDNSYISSDKINQIDFSFKEKNADVFNVYKGLFALRKNNPHAFGKNESASAEILCEGIVDYKTCEFEVIFNASENDFTADVSSEKILVDVASGQPIETALPCASGEKNRINVKALSFIILKNKN